MQLGLGISPTVPLGAAASGPTNGLVWNTASDYLTVNGTDYIIWQ